MTFWLVSASHTNLVSSKGCPWVLSFIVIVFWTTPLVLTICSSDKFYRCVIDHRPFAKMADILLINILILALLALFKVKYFEFLYSMLYCY